MSFFKNYFNEKFQSVEFNLSFKADYSHYIIKLFYTLKYLLNILMKIIIYIHVTIKNLYKVDNIKNKNKNKSCVIIGSGPSINNIDISKLNKFDTIAVNNIYKHKNFKKLNLTYLCLMDGAYFNPTKDYYPISRKNPLVKKRLKEIKNNSVPINKLIKKQTTMIFPRQIAYESQSKFNFYKHKKIKYVEMLSHHMADFIPSNINFKSGIPFTYNVIPWAICFAILLNYKKIYLIGCEQNMYLNSNAHFYKNKKTIITEVLRRNNLSKHKQKNIIKKQLYPGCSNHLGIWSTEKILLYHINLKKLAIKKGIKIYDCTTGGILDMYKNKKL